jgi:hypothetical protein
MSGSSENDHHCFHVGAGFRLRHVEAGFSPPEEKLEVLCGFEIYPLPAKSNTRGLKPAPTNKSVNFHASPGAP